MKSGVRTVVFIAFIAFLMPSWAWAQSFGGKTNPSGTRKATPKSESPSGGGFLKQFQNLKNSLFSVDDQPESPPHGSSHSQMQRPTGSPTKSRIEPFAKQPLVTQPPAPIVSAPSRYSRSDLDSPVGTGSSLRRAESSNTRLPITKNAASDSIAADGSEASETYRDRRPASDSTNETPTIYSTPSAAVSPNISSRRSKKSESDSMTSDSSFEILDIDSGPAIDRSKASSSIEDDDAPRVPRKSRTFQPLPMSEEVTQPTAKPVPTNLTSSARSMTTRTAPTEENPSSSMNMGMPSVRLQCLGPQAIEIGKPTTYQIQAMNEGTSQIRGLLVRVKVPAEVELLDLESHGSEADGEESDDGIFVLWTAADLAPGQTRVLDLLVEPKQAKPFTFEFEYTVTPNVAQMQVQVQKADLMVSLEGPSETLFGKSESYRLKVRNSGTATAKQVTVAISAETFGRSDAEVGDLRPGEERSLDVDLTFMQMGTVQLAIEGSCSQSNVRASNLREILVRKANLSAEWIVPPEQYLNAEAEYVVVIHNHGSIACEQIKCTAQLPARSQLLQVPKGMNLDGETLTWFIPRIEPNGQAQFILPLKLVEEGVNTFYVRTSGSAGGMAECSAETRVESVVDLKLQAQTPNAPAPVGEPVEYVLVISNRGTKAATSVRAIMQFSEGIEPQRCIGLDGKIVPGQVLFEPIGFIGPGKEVRLTVVALAEVSGTHRFRAEVRSDDYEAPLAQEAATRFLITGKRKSEPASNPK